MNHRQRMLSITVAALGLAALACTCGMPQLGGPSPSATVPVSQEAAKQVSTKLERAAAQAKTTGQYKVTLTESEVTSYLAAQIQQQQKQGQTVPVTNPQIKFTQGQAWVYGTFQSGSSKINGLVVASLQVQNGKLAIKIVRADFGAVPVPAALLDQLNQQIQVELDKQSSQPQGITLTGITIREGEIEVAGKATK
jgi:hypothetical protein